MIPQIYTPIQIESNLLSRQSMNAMIYSTIKAYQSNQFASVIEQRHKSSPSSLYNLVSSLISGIAINTQHRCAEFTVTHLGL